MGYWVDGVERRASALLSSSGALQGRCRPFPRGALQHTLGSAASRPTADLSGAPWTSLSAFIDVIHSFRSLKVPRGRNSRLCPRPQEGSKDLKSSTLGDPPHRVIACTFSPPSLKCPQATPTNFHWYVQFLGTDHASLSVTAFSSPSKRKSTKGRRCACSSSAPSSHAAPV